MLNFRETALKPIGLYIHIPWCIQKCPYCDFNSHAIKSSSTPERHYIDTLLVDLQQDLQRLDSPAVISSIFIGGGTPSLFSADSFNHLITEIQRLISFQPHIEITLEANPSTVENQKLADYRRIGVNRLSIGVQSFNSFHLKKLGRVHSVNEAINAIKMAKKAGFEQLNIDLMFGLPKQSIKEMLYDVQTAIQLNPSHISFYQLTLEPNTYFHKFPPSLPKEELIIQGQQQCQQLLADAGYQQYEISAYAKANQHCQHNINYWSFGDYLGIGAGAHGKMTRIQTNDIIRTVKLKSPEQYLNNSQATIIPITKDELPIEFLMNQLRLKTGFTLAHYTKVTGLDQRSLQPTLSQCLQQGLLTENKGYYSCSNKGWNFIDSILEQFI